MAISFQSDEEIMRNLRAKLRKMSDEELIRFGKEVRRLAENPFQRHQRSSFTFNGLLVSSFIVSLQST